MTQTYLGVKLVDGTPMTRLAYNQYRGWELPTDEDGADAGYLVEYLDGGAPNHPDHKGYISWSPTAVFEGSYRPTTGLPFGLAIEALKKGARITRPSWNGKGMWLVLVKEGHYDVGCRTVDYRTDCSPEDGPSTKLAPWIGMRTAQRLFTPWAPAQSDVLADDWQIVSREAALQAPAQ